MLRRAWKAGTGNKAAWELVDERGRPFWATPGRYINKNMLRAFVNTLGHEHEHLLKRASRRGRGSLGLLVTATDQISNQTKEDEDNSDSSDSIESVASSR